MVHKVWGQTDPPSGLGRISVHYLALNIYVMSHNALPRVSLHLKTRQEYLFYDEESFGMLKTGFGGTWYLPFLAPLLLIFLREMGQNVLPGQLLPHFCCNDILY